MNAEKGNHHEISPEFRAVQSGVDRLQTVKFKKDKKSKKAVTIEFQKLEKIYDSSADDVVRLAIVCGISDLTNSRQLLERVLLNDREPLIRHEAAFGLGLTKDPAATALIIEKGLNDVNDVVRHESALALGTIGSPIALEALEELLENERSYGKGIGENIVAPSCEIAIAGINMKQRKIS